MRKRRNPNPSPPTYTLEEEINTKNYPYYRTIPLKHISDKQYQILDRHNVLSTVPSEEPPKHQSYNVEYDNSITEYNGSIPEQQVPEQYVAPIPVFNLIQNPGEHFYRVNMPQQPPHQGIDANDKKLNAQEEIINANNASIAKQVEIIHTQNITINRNNAYIQQQMYAYSNNLGIVQQQSDTYQTNASYITEQEQTIESLKEQVQDYDSQIEQQKQEIEANQQQLAYHSTMLSAFNTMLQNPAYFTQLVSMSMSGFMPPDGYNPT
jgi:hypothetical protein